MFKAYVLLLTCIVCLICYCRVAGNARVEKNDEKKTRLLFVRSSFGRGKTESNKGATTARSLQREKRTRSSAYRG